MKKNTTQCKWQFFTILQKLPCYYYVQRYSCKQMLYLMIRLITTLIRIIERTYLTFIKKCLWMLYLLWYKALAYPYIYLYIYEIYYNFYLERAYCALDKFFELKKFIRKPLMHRVLKIELDIQCLHKTVCIISSEWLLIEHAAKGLQDLMKLMVAIT